MSDRMCFLLRVRPERLGEYLAAHDAVWPEMLDALRRTGWRDYSLFLHEEEGLVVGYFECEDPAAAMSAMANEAVNERWQATMAPFFAPTAAGVGPGQAVILRQYFHLT